MSSAKTTFFPLDHFWSNLRTDNYSTANTEAKKGALKTKYRFVRTDGYILKKPLNTEGEAVPLYLYYSDTRKDNFITATHEGIRDAKASGYRKVRVDGYVLKTVKPQYKHLYKPLWLYYNHARKDNFTIATPQGMRTAEAGGYRKVRIEGYVRLLPDSPNTGELTPLYKNKVFFKNVTKQQFHKAKFLGDAPIDKNKVFSKNAAKQQFNKAEFLGDAPSFTRTNYSSKIQGISNNKDYWFFTQLTKIKKIPVGYDLTKDANNSSDSRIKTAWMPKVLSNLGYDHFGDPDNFNGYLFVPVQTPPLHRDKNDNPVHSTAVGNKTCPVGDDKKKRRFPVIAVFDENTLEFINYYKLSGRSEGGWVTINPITKELYTSVPTITRDKPIVRYSINWNTLHKKVKETSGELKFTRQGPFHINYNALPNDWPKRGFDSYMQGGDFSDDGVFLYLTNGITKIQGGWTRSRGLHIIKNVNHKTGIWKKSSTQSGSNGLKYKYKSTRQEPEGLTYFDLRNDNRITDSKLKCQVHAILYTHAPSSKHLLKYFKVYITNEN